jgi:Flp pilus assembly pilin Flp
MNTPLGRALELLRGEDGPTAVEYGLLLAVIACVALTSMAMFGQRMSAIHAFIANSVANL